MESLKLKQADFPDFMRAFQYVMYTCEGLSISEAAKQANIPRSSLYEDRWQDLVNTAQRAYYTTTMTTAYSFRNRVLAEFPALLGKYMMLMNRSDVSLRDMTAAMQFLHEAVISKVTEIPKSDDKERAYLAQGGNFNPMTPVANAIQANAGSTIIINNTGEKPATGDVVIENPDD